MTFPVEALPRWETYVLRKGSLNHVPFNPCLCPVRHWRRNRHRPRRTVGGADYRALPDDLLRHASLRSGNHRPGLRCPGSAISAWTYSKSKNIDIKNGVVLLLSILVFTLVGSYVGQFVPNTIVKYFAILMVCSVGTKFIVWPVMTSKTEMANRPFGSAQSNPSSLAI